MPRVKLILEYDGTAYVGWQYQTNGPSIQERVECAVEALVGQRVPVVAAGRTDSGVHARGQVVAFDSPVALPVRAYWMGLNTHLPFDIAVVKAEEVAPEFDPRRWATGKRYRYSVSNRRSRSPLRRRTHWEVFADLDVRSMVEAATALVGHHDFSAFRAADCQAAHARRELKRVEVAGEAGSDITFEFEGTAFVKHMVRNLVGSLMEIGKKRRSAVWLKGVLESGDRRLAGATAPAHGLCLEEVFYGAGPREDGAEDEP